MWKPLAVLPVLALVTATRPPSGAGVSVHYLEGLSHGFLVLTTTSGVRLADGELTQIVRNADVDSRLVFRFIDGSLYDDRTVFSQHDRFRLVSDHVVEKGPAFPQPMDETIDAATGQVTVSYADHGKQKQVSAHLDLPPDVANGMLLQVLKNVRRSESPTSVSYVVTTPQPRVVKLMITASGDASISTGTVVRKAVRYTIHVDIGGLTGFVARLLGKQPPDSSIWILPDDAPAFIAAEYPFFTGGPLWRVSLVAPKWKPER